MRSLARAFANGFRGIGALLSTQRNSRFHLGATIAVVALGLWVGIGPSDWALLSMAIAAVWIAEAFNTALEFLSDAACPGRNPLVGRAKDVAARRGYFCFHRSSGRWGVCLCPGTLSLTIVYRSVG